MKLQVLLTFHAAALEDYCLRMAKGFLPTLPPNEKYIAEMRVSYDSACVLITSQEITTQDELPNSEVKSA